MAIQQIVGMDGDGLSSLIQERIGYRLVGFQLLIIDQLYLLIFDGIHMTWTSWTKTQFLRLKNGSTHPILNMKPQNGLADFGIEYCF